MQPLEGARVLVLSVDPFVVEPLATVLEADGAEVTFRTSTDALPDPDTLDAVVVHPSIRGAAPDDLDDFLDSLPDETVLLEGTHDAYEAILDALGSFGFDAAAPNTDATDGARESSLGARRFSFPPLPAWTGTRTGRAAITVLVVTALLWLIGRAQLNDRAAVLPGTAVGPGVGLAPAGQLAGRVTRAGGSEGITGAAVVATGPSGSMSTATDAQGRWRFSDLRGGRYIVMSTAPRHVAKQQQVDVPEGRAVENVNFSLDPEAP